MIPLKIVGVFSSDGGKFGDDHSDLFAIANYKTMVSHPLRYLYPSQSFLKTQGTEFYQFGDSENANRYAKSIIINLKDRNTIYLDSNFDNLQLKVTGFASQVVNDLGVYPIEVDWLVLNELYSLRFATMFLAIVLNIIIVVLFTLSVMLLYNLLLVSIETKTYELGVLRVLGLNKLGIISLIITQSLSYVFPAVIAGFAASFPILQLVMGALKNAMGV